MVNGIKFDHVNLERSAAGSGTLKIVILKLKLEIILIQKTNIIYKDIIRKTQIIFENQSHYFLNPPHIMTNNINTK